MPVCSTTRSYRHYRSVVITIGIGMKLHGLGFVWALGCRSILVYLEGKFKHFHIFTLQLSLAINDSRILLLASIQYILIIPLVQVFK